MVYSMCVVLCYSTVVYSYLVIFCHVLLRFYAVCRIKQRSNTVLTLRGYISQIEMEVRKLICMSLTFCIVICNDFDFNSMFIFSIIVFCVAFSLEYHFTLKVKKYMLLVVLSWSFSQSDVLLLKLKN